MGVSPLVWGATIAMFVIMLAYEFIAHGRHEGEPSLKESGVWSVVYLVAAIAFGGVVWKLFGKAHAVEYVTGYVTERALSIDNLFVFILIMASFSVPRRLQQEVMLVGVAIAIVLRGIFIALGAAIIEQFSWVFYLFGIFLIFTGVKLAREDDSEDEEYEESLLIRLVRRVVPVSSDYHGNKLTIRDAGRRMITPLAIVMIAIGSTDLLFAFDSIPAIFGLTREPYIVFAANAWALMGMVQLYFLLGGMLQRLRYLSYGLAFILAFIGAKLIIHALHTNELPFINGGHHVDSVPEIPTWLSLAVIVVTIAVAAIFSLRRPVDETPHHA